ncbi:efflux RND transporter periplasmic adaptor subunit [Alkalihalobacterium elongatum]|uniref:efflux RND transporter periplasmic adaptor subunit n=1 Tax=Alkalihalobacterium elongatum TaxID=2675466 RepID=UPI001C1FD776|nr:efflux RND transporter periplasmic adaptor subunit [Alkalihalobacterium elongatum]
MYKYFNFKSICFICLILFIAGCATDDITSDSVERQSLLVSVEEAKQSEIRQTLELNGQMLPKEQVPLFTVTPLEVKEIHKKVGENVKRGDLLITLDAELASEQVAHAKKAVSELEKALNQANELNRTAQNEIQRLQTLQQELEQSLNATRGAIENLDEENPDVALLEFIRSSLELSLKQAELAQAAGAIQQVPRINTTELEIQLETAKHNVRQAEQGVQATRLTAPIAGVIAQMDVTVGQMAVPNSPLAVIVNLDPVVATFSANSFQISKLQPGMDVSIGINGLNQKYENSITTVSPVVNPQTNTFTVEAEIENPDLFIKGGMRATALVDLGTIDEAIVIPIGSILYEDNEAFVFKVNENTVIKQSVELGSREGDLIEVVEGIEVNDTVVTTGKERLTDGAQITIRNE